MTTYYIPGLLLYSRCVSCDAVDSNPDDPNCDEGELVRMYENTEDFCDCCQQRCVTFKQEGEYCYHSTNKPIVLVG